MNKKKIIVGISLIITAILFIAGGIYLFSTLPNTEYLITVKEGLTCFGGFISCMLGVIGLIVGVGMIIDDLF